jgi:hypothetical protein
LGRQLEARLLLLRIETTAKNLIGVRVMWKIRRNRKSKKQRKIKKLKKEKLKR